MIAVMFLISNARKIHKYRRQKNLLSVQFNDLVRLFSFFVVGTVITVPNYLYIPT